MPEIAYTLTINTIHQITKEVNTMPTILYFLGGILIGVPLFGIVRSLIGTGRIAKKLRQTLMMLH